MPVEYQLSFRWTNNQLSQRGSHLKLQATLTVGGTEPVRIETEEANSILKDIAFVRKLNTAHVFGTVHQLIVYILLGNQEKFEITNVSLPRIMQDGTYENATKWGTLLTTANAVSTDNKKIIKFIVNVQYKSYKGTELHIYRADENGETLAYKHAITVNDNRIEIEKMNLCQNDDLRDIHIRFMKLNKKRFESVISVSFTISDLKEKNKIHVNDAKKKAELKVYNFSEQELYSLEQFITNGLNINCAIAIDFTMSNKDRHDPTSLHHNTSTHRSPYATVIQELVEVLNQYDSDNKYPVYGFGAFPTNEADRVSHCFSLNHRGHCIGVEGVINAYLHALNDVVPSGPTLLEPVITAYTQMIRRTNATVEYFILVILTDGDLNDETKTKRAIIKVTDLPLSIIIIGIGEDPVSKFKILQEIDNNLMLDGECASRDIVKFVHFLPYEKMRKTNLAEFKRQFAKEVLCEVPDQVKEFMSLNNTTPENIQAKILQSGNAVRESILEGEKLL